MWLEARADDFSDEIARLMARAGVERVAFGLESASPAILRGLDKHLDPCQVRHAVEAAFAAGLDVELFSQYALPGERLEDALGTLDFVTGCGVAIRGNSNAQQMQLYFGSDVSRRPGQHGIHPTRASFPPHLAVGTEYRTDWMSADDIARVRDAWREASIDGGRRVVS
jgi:hypothetical protein